MVLFLTSINFKSKLQNVLEENVLPYQGNKRNSPFISCYYSLQIRCIKSTYPNYEHDKSNIRLSLSFTGKSSISRTPAKSWIIPIWKFGAKSIVKVRLWDFNCHSKTTYTAFLCYFHLPNQHPRVTLTLKEKKINPNYTSNCWFTKQKATCDFGFKTQFALGIDGWKNF